MAALPDGGFVVADEYGPSLLFVSAAGVVRERWTPEGLDIPGAGCPVHQRLPAASLKRRLNRGFEAVAASADGARLFLALQSPIKGERAVRIWVLDAASGALLGEHAYPLDPPHSFRADAEDGPVDRSDLKVCELVWLGPDRLLVLERITRTSRLYAVRLDRERLHKTPVFDSDLAGEVCADIEGVALLSPDTLLLVNDNDFGVEGAVTRFYRLRFAAPI